MKWIPDNTGKFKKRPLFSSQELELACESIVTNFLLTEHKVVQFPIETGDLTILIEQHTQDFDSCKDLSDEGEDVEGVTYFTKGEKPIVCISHKLQERYLENRLRTTLTHELFHVLFHNQLYQVEDHQPSLFQSNPASTEENVHKCKRDNITAASTYDWMEWQAGYGCGAFLMPFSFLQEAVFKYKTDFADPFEDFIVFSTTGQALIEQIAQRFQTSKDAARVRLLQLKFIQESSSPSLPITNL